METPIEVRFGSASGAYQNRAGTNATAPSVLSRSGPSEISQKNISTLTMIRTTLTTGTVRRGFSSRSGIMFFVCGDQCPATRHHTLLALHSHRRRFRIDDLDEHAGAELEAGDGGESRKELDVKMSSFRRRKTHERPVVRRRNPAHARRSGLQKGGQFGDFAFIELVRLG